MQSIQQLRITFFIILTVTVTALTWYTIKLTRNGHITSQPAFTNKLQPVTNIVFIKTHKTASTSLHCILCRYGYTNQLSFLFSKYNRKNGHLRNTALSTSQFLPPIRSRKYNILTGHVTYSRSRIDSFMEGSPKYITILREPATQIESHMNFFHHRESIMKGAESFNKNSSRFENGGKAYGRNNQMLDLGLKLLQTADETFVNATIQRLDKEFDVVLISEYFDESLVLLRHILHWSFDDILYLSKNQRTDRETITDDFRRKIYQWSRADVLLYQYFNETFWRRIQQYGPGFEDDLAFFRYRLNEINNRCSTSQTTIIESHKPKLLKYKSRNNSILCQHLTYSNIDWFKHIAIRQGPKAFKHKF